MQAHGYGAAGRHSAFRIADHDRQVLLPAVGRAEGDDGGVPRQFQRHPRIRHPDQAGGRVALVVLDIERGHRQDVRRGRQAFRPQRPGRPAPPPRRAGGGPASPAPSPRSRRPHGPAAGSAPEDRPAGPRRSSARGRPAPARDPRPAGPPGSKPIGAGLSHPSARARPRAGMSRGRRAPAPVSWRICGETVGRAEFPLPAQAAPVRHRAARARSCRAAGRRRPGRPRGGLPAAGSRRAGRCRRMVDRWESRLVGRRSQDEGRIGRGGSPPDPAGLPDQPYHRAGLDARDGAAAVGVAMRPAPC